ncbi:MAG: hypothetical protein MN733_44335 [Nitrososphaera sp.]|nr:hypothetical protein [Nitrososphaera sp.]
MSIEAPIQGLGLRADQVITRPNFRKWSSWQAGAAVTNFDGFLASQVTSAGTFSRVVNANGNYNILSTGATSGTQAGQRTSQATFNFCRAINPLMMLRFQLVTDAIQQIFFGFHSSSSAFNVAEDPLNAKWGVGFGMRSADTNWQIIGNDNTGATEFQDTGIAIDTTVHTLSVLGLEAQSKWQVQLDNAIIDVTTGAPGSTTGLNMEVGLRNNEAVDKSLNYWWSYYGIDA